jgi:hypothetical protein
MSNVIDFTKRRQFKQPQSLCERVLARIRSMRAEQPQYAAVPKHISANPQLNRIITDLQTKGWMIVISSGAVEFTHPEIEKQRFALSEAIQLQRTIEYSPIAR